MSTTRYIVMHRPTGQYLRREYADDFGPDIICMVKCASPAGIVDALFAGKIDTFTEDDLKYCVIDDFDIDPTDLVLIAVTIAITSAMYINHPEVKPKE